MEWDDAKDEGRLKKYYQFNMNKRAPYFTKKIDEGIVKEVQGWGDGSGHIIGLIIFENAEDFAKFWSDEEWQLLQLEFFPLVDNYKIRVMRPGMRPKDIE